jgi:hypothetical protein
LGPRFCAYRRRHRYQPLSEVIGVAGAPLPPMMLWLLLAEAEERGCLRSDARS